MYRIIRILIIIMLVAVMMMVFKNLQKPKTLGVINGKLSQVPDTPNGVSTQTNDQSKSVDPLPYKETREESVAVIKKVVMAYGGGQIKEETSNYLYVVFTTGRMKYKDDAEFYFDDASTLIHFRSASRIGYSDMGLNAERYHTISELYLKE